MSKARSWAGLIGFGAAVAAAGWYGSRFSPRNDETRDWYEGLEKPVFNPPEWLFPVVWTPLYALMAISGWSAWRSEDSPERGRALWVWALQLAANAGWTQLFFGARKPKLALADVALLEALIAGYIASTAEFGGLAAWCFVPYAGWVGFATVLNAEIVRLNRTDRSATAEAAGD